MNRIKAVFILCCALVMAPTIAATANAAGVPDVMLESVKGSRVDLSTSTGKLMSGTLQAFDENVVVMFMDDNSVITVPRAEVLAIRVVQQPVTQQQPVYAPQQAPAAVYQQPGGLYQVAPTAPPVRPAKSAGELAQIQALRASGAEEIARGRLLNGISLALGIPGLLGCLLGPVALGVYLDDDGLDLAAANAARLGLSFCAGFTPPAIAADITGDTLRRRGAAKVEQADLMMSRRLLFRPTDFRLAMAPGPNGGSLGMSFRF